MSSWLIAVMVGAGAAAWAYSQLAHLNGNANPQNNIAGAIGLGLVAFLVVVSLLKFVVNFGG